MRITNVSVQCYSYPMIPIHRDRFGNTQEATLITVESDEGTVGHATARAQGGTSGRVIAEAILATAKPRLLGKDPFLREEIWQTLWLLDRASYMQVFATSAIDVALWDLTAKYLGVPIWRLLGGYRQRLPAYASSATLANVEDYVTEARHCLARGYRAYKIHPMNDPDRDIEIASAVRDAVGPDVVLMLDPAGAYDHAQALRVGRKLEQLRYFWYEEPINDYDLRGYSELCRALDIPVVAAEVVPGAFRSTAQYIQQGAGDILRADVYWRGGITGVMKTAHLCEAYGIKAELHHSATPLMDVANLHCACAIPNCDYFEVLVPEDSYRYGLKEYPGIDEDGFVHAPVKPGLGVEIDWDYIDNHTTFSG